MTRYSNVENTHKSKAKKRIAVRKEYQSRPGDWCQVGSSAYNEKKEEYDCCFPFYFGVFACKDICVCVRKCLAECTVSDSLVPLNAYTFQVQERALLC